MEHLHKLATKGTFIFNFIFHPNTGHHPYPPLHRYSYSYPFTHPRPHPPPTLPL